ncbi:hypothetical protein JVT61DRAFT_435 [Boletus reticuloceps]|uniref:Uncharacterized protein n=1 Tax=Boletus reticuloceps TaxID=495285 RepID=A0A8I3ADS3_9AGAM|nr:hypothetical protein JVT61DRAFT_435 [Boletus reticuloceps]
MKLLPYQYLDGYRPFQHGNCDPNHQFDRLLHCDLDTYKTSMKNFPRNLLSPFHLSREPPSGCIEWLGVTRRSSTFKSNGHLNPAAESHDIFSASDKDIYDAVMEAKRAREQSMLMMTMTRNPSSPTRLHAKKLSRRQYRSGNTQRISTIRWLVNWRQYERHEIDLVFCS